MPSSSYFTKDSVSKLTDKTIAILDGILNYANDNGMVITSIKIDYVDVGVNNTEMPKIDATFDKKPVVVW